MIKLLRNIVLGVVLVLGLVLFFSPFTKNQDNGEWELETSIVIDVNVDSVYAYLGNSAHAANWSSYVNHITPLNADSIPDGHKGSKRRCFKNENEEGIVWDEEVLLIRTRQRKYRELSISAMHGFPLQTEDLVTRQHYERLDDNTTKLTFGLYKLVDKSSTLDVLKMKLAGYYIESFFKKNVTNIKRELEKK